jgi:methionyl-tRNA formyltransferase
VGVVTVADKPAGRGQQLNESAVKKYAVANHLHIMQPEKLRNEDFLSELKSLEADLFVVVAFRMLPEAVWQMPPMGTINLHGSLLPKYRGAAPINWAIINGEKETGVTTFFLQHEVDTGNIIQQTKIRIGENDTVGQVHDRMMLIGAETLVQTVDKIAQGNAHAIPQQQLIAQGNAIVHAPKIFKENCLIDWSKSADEVHNFVRGLSPYPGAYTTFEGKMLKIYFGKKIMDDQIRAAAGEAQTDNKNYLQFACTNGWYSTTEVQLEGKKRMGVEEFLRGRRPVQ